MSNQLYENNRGKEHKKQCHPKPNLDFKKMKNNTIKSLNEVEYFLHDFKKFCNYIKLYKILK